MDLWTDASRPGARNAEDIREMAEEWRRRNPEAYGCMVALARDAMRHGKRTSIAQLAETIRYSPEVRVSYRVGDFKVNNTLRAPLARMIERENPDLKGVFAMRQSKVDGL